MEAKRLSDIVSFDKIFLNIKQVEGKHIESVKNSI